MDVRAAIKVETIDGHLIHEVDNLHAAVGEIVPVQARVSSEIRKFPVEDTVAINLHSDPRRRPILSSPGATGCKTGM